MVKEGSLFIQFRGKEDARGTMRNPNNVLISLRKHSKEESYTYKMANKKRGLPVFLF
ncbi:MAG TPA: hypothetical protein GX530_06730 [Corynebacteriales bacterium]|jgi:hypothetical protein|nr:hypothetical protein [Mycobacteriales bacterium]